jgi:hypothetical protein
MQPVLDKPDDSSPNGVTIERSNQQGQLHTDMNPSLEAIAELGDVRDPFAILTLRNLLDNPSIAVGEEALEFFEQPVRVDQQNFFTRDAQLTRIINPKPTAIAGTSLPLMGSGRVRPISALATLGLPGITSRLVQPWPP